MLKISVKEESIYATKCLKSAIFVCLLLRDYEIAILTPPSTHVNAT